MLEKPSIQLVRSTINQPAKNKLTPMKQFFLQLFTWWNRQTLGTRFFTWRSGVEVGRDDRGNIYYRSAKPHPHLGERRWVIYAGTAEASEVPGGWYGWLHHMSDELPNSANSNLREWQKPHQANMTGTAQAYRPEGSILRSGQRPAATGDYQAWQPE